MEEIILCSLKILFIVCYVASVPVCVCDGRTILFCPVLGVFCDDDAQRATHELTNNSRSSDSLFNYRVKCVRSQLRKRYLYIVHSRPKLRTWVTQLRKKSYCVRSLKVLFIVCYIARVPVCVCDGRTILFCPELGVFCDATRNANSQIIVLISLRILNTTAPHATTQDTINLVSREWEVLRTCLPGRNCGRKQKDTNLRRDTSIHKPTRTH